MSADNQINIVTYGGYKDLLLPNEGDVDALLNHKIKDFDPIESIRFSSFWNMVCQTTEMIELLQIQRKELRNFNEFKLDYPPNTIFFHRDNILHYITRVISQKVNGRKKITGSTNKDNALKYYQTLLLINSKIDFLHYQNLEREIIKSFPYHFPNTLFWFYNQRIIRYSFIYRELLPTKADKCHFLLDGIELMEKHYNLRFLHYVKTIISLFNWFLAAKEPGLDSPKFEMDKLDSFYIKKGIFDDETISVIEALSKDLEGFQNDFKKEKRDKIDNDIFYYFQRFFDFPIFKSKENVYCIIDFKFLIEGICGGLVWKIDSIIRNNHHENYSIQQIKEQYGYLLEEYFAFLVKKIFPDAELTFDQKGMPDCVIEFQEENRSYVLVLEFSTKYFKISSLYNKTSDNFVKDLDRILFRKKKNDRGKFINLNNYINDYKSQNKKVIPILVTENWLGDFDLLNRFNNVLLTRIRKNKLENLILYKPIILSLDDLETFWAISTRGNEIPEFIAIIERWEKTVKGKYLFNLSNFISDGKRINSREYCDFFEPANLVAADPT